MRIIDTHAHLSELGDWDGVIERAKKAGIKAIVAVGSNLNTCIETLRWAETYPGYVHPALGLHPTEWNEGDVELTFHFIEDHLNDCIAVGEIGLDYWYREAKDSAGIREKQRQIYLEQLKMARKYGKPVSIHGRGAWVDANALARKHGPDLGVFHWYSGPIDILEEIIDSGYYISATPASEFSKHHRAALSKTPLEKIVLETDSPVSYHGKQAEPADVLLTLKSLADLKGISEKEAAKITSRNAERLFRL